MQKVNCIDDYLVNAVYALLVKIKRSFSHNKKVIVKEKGTADFVTNIDYQIEQKIKIGLKQISDIPCLAEESKQIINALDYWVIDPIDGTTNFIHGYPSYCISIAKVKNNITEYGFVYNLVSGELFIGIKGQGAYIYNKKVEKKISVSEVKYVSDALIGFGCPYNKERTDKLFLISNRLLKECHDLKRNGPASLDLCYVACGRLDAYYEFDLQEWDYKAAKLILEEAGGKITDWNGRSITKGKCSVAASNKKIHEQLLSFLHE